MIKSDKNVGTDIHVNFKKLNTMQDEDNCRQENLTPMVVHSDQVLYYNKARISYLTIFFVY